MHSFLGRSYLSAPVGTEMKVQEIRWEFSSQKTRNHKQHASQEAEEMAIPHSRFQPRLLGYPEV